MRAFAIVFAGLLFATPALAQPTGNESGGSSGGNSSAGSNEPESEEDLDRRVCRRIETNTGSRVPHRLVCMTVRQWRAQNSRR